MVGTSNPTFEEEQVAEPAEYRLPPTARPRRYELELAVDLERARFEGSETVHLDLLEPTDRLVLNALELAVDHATVADPSGRRLEGTIVSHQQAQQLSILLGEPLAPGEGYRLYLSFRGSLNERLQGFYLSSFTSEDGTEQVLASTQFEPTDARRAFPCWDEPAFKAVFSISLVIPDELTAISNGAELTVEPAGPGRKRVRFADTIPMSTYLVAFVVGPFELTPEVRDAGVPIRVAAVRGKSHLTSYALRAATHALDFLARYFDIPYPGTKLDHVAIPDFSFGAMENFGCVTYRESTLLADPDRASQLELQRIATVVAHETAHMWFGDLVTMKWWNGIWLNEAFATFMELLTADAFNPEWDVWSGFSAGKAAALLTDGLRATRPIEFPVGRPEEAEAMFDLLTYQKGGSVLRMLEQYLGPETFRKGISHYLQVHSYSNTETSDLWDALETTSGEPVRSITDSWIWQGGHPLVEAAEAEEGGTELVLRQRRFLDDGGTDESTWAVPVNLRASVGGAIQHQRTLLRGPSTTVSFDGPIDWVVINDGAWGFYRVRYSPGLWERLAGAGLLEVCTPLERFALLSDTWAQVVAGSFELGAWAATCRALLGDDDPDVWAAIGLGLSLLRAVASNGDLPALRSFTAEIAGPVWAALGWDQNPGESARTATARSRVLATLGLVGEDTGVREEAAQRFSRHLAGEPGLSPDVAGVTLRIVVAAGGTAEWEAVLERYRQAQVPQEKLRYLYALAEAGQPDLVDRTLELMLSREVRSQDAPLVVANLLGRPESAGRTWQWLVDCWEELSRRFPHNLIIRMFEALPAAPDAARAAAVRQFCTSHDIPGAGPRLDQVLERLDINVRLAGRLRGSLVAGLSR